MKVVKARSICFVSVLSSRTLVYLSGDAWASSFANWSWWMDLADRVLVGWLLLLQVKIVIQATMPDARSRSRAMEVAAKLNGIVYSWTPSHPSITHFESRRICIDSFMHDDYNSNSNLASICVMIESLCRGEHDRNHRRPQGPAGGGRRRHRRHLPGHVLAQEALPRWDPAGGGSEARGEEETRGEEGGAQALRVPGAVRVHRRLLLPAAAADGSLRGPAGGRLPHHVKLVRWDLVMHICIRVIWFPPYRCIYKYRKQIKVTRGSWGCSCNIYVFFWQHAVIYMLVLWKKWFTSYIIQTVGGIKENYLFKQNVRYCRFGYFFLEMDGEVINNCFLLLINSLFHFFHQLLRWEHCKNLAMCGCRGWKHLVYLKNDAPIDFNFGASSVYVSEISDRKKNMFPIFEFYKLNHVGG